MEPTIGFEPMTNILQICGSTNWAKSASKEYENGSGWGIWTHQSEDYETSVLAIAPTRNNEIKMVGVTGFEPALSSPQTRSETITGYTPRKNSHTENQSD